MESDLLSKLSVFYKQRPIVALVFQYVVRMSLSWRQLGYHIYKVSLNQELCYTSRKLIFIVIYCLASAVMVIH